MINGEMLLKNNVYKHEDHSCLPPEYAKIIVTAAGCKCAYLL